MNIPVLRSRIESVTVYRQGAMVCRAAAVPGDQAAPSQVKLGNLPLSLEDGSVRVRMEGEGGELPVASEVRVTLELAAVDEGLPPPEDAALKQARRELAELADRVAHLQSQRERYERLQIFERPANKRGAPPLASPVRARLALTEFRDRAIAAADDDMHAAQTQLRRAQQRTQAPEHRHRAASQARQARPHELRKAAIISLRGQSTVTAPVRIIIEYMIPGARWAPSYAISLSKDMTQASVAVRASVAQDSGEDWTGVKLTLSTADAQRWTELPELQALRVGRRQAQARRRGWRAPPAGAQELYADYDRLLGSTSSPMTREPREEGSTGARSLPSVSDEAQAGERAWDGEMAGEMAGAMDGEEAREEARPSPVRSASGSASSPMRGSPAAPMAPAAPRVALAAKSRGGAPGGGLTGFGGAAADGAVGAAQPAGAWPVGPTPEPEHEAAPEQLAYGDLRMPGPQDGRRGSLVVSQRRERYFEMLWVREVSREIDVVATIDEAVMRARRAGSGGPPPRHTLADSQGGFDYVYAADGAVEIPSDGGYHGIALMARPAPVELGYVVVPRESTEVFRRVTLQNPLDAPLLPGPADVYVGGDYLLSTELRLAGPRGAVELGLGVEQAIKVARNTSFAEEATGLIGGSLALRHEVVVEVANRRDRAIEVEVRERLPTLREREDEVQLEVAVVDPPWVRYEPEEYVLKGGHRWQVQVPAGQKRQLRVVYVIKISAKKELVGGNRREQ